MDVDSNQYKGFDKCLKLQRDKIHMLEGMLKSINELTQQDRYKEAKTLLNGYMKLIGESK